MEDIVRGQEPDAGRGMITFLVWRIRKLQRYAEINHLGELPGLTSFSVELPPLQNP